VAFADRMLLNKVDLVSAEDLERIEKRLKTMNSFAPILRCQQSEVSVDSVLDIKGFDLKRTLEMDPEFLSTDNEHEHDSSVTSLSISHDGEVDLDMVQEWVSNILQNLGTDIYRMKGVLAIANANEKFVYQAVHMIFNGNFEGEKWQEGEPKSSKLVFIGKNLDHETLKAGFLACAVTPELIQKKIDAMRFKIGSKVQCNVGDEWANGEVVKLNYRDEFMPPGMVAPYQVKLDNGSLIYAPQDINDVVRAA